MTQTIAIADATAADLSHALANPVPPPVTPPNPGPPSTVTAPFVVSSAQPLATLVTGPDGPILMLGYDTNTKIPWLYLRSYLQGDTSTGHYPGSFIAFQCFNRAGVMGTPVILNAGYIDDTAGKEQGDLDIGVLVDAAQTIVSVTGKYTPVGTMNTQPPGILVWPPDQMNVGSVVNRFEAGGYKILPVRPGMPPAASGCIDMGGVYVPVYS